MTGRTLSKAETVDGALAPPLTKWDQKLLRAVPVSPTWDDKGWSPAARGLDPWLVARAMRETNVALVRSALKGLEDRHLVKSIGWDGSRSMQRWVAAPPSREMEAE